MTITNKILALTAAAFFALPAAAHAEVKIGDDLSAYSFTDSKGVKHTVSEFKGKPVVFEWNNPGCPFVVKHYDSKNMQETQKYAAEHGAVWISVNSSAAGKEGNLKDDTEVQKYLTQTGAAPTAYVLDGDGSIGHYFGANNTPSMFVTDANGKVVYTGAIDSIPSADAADIKAATNYIKQALHELKEGKAVSVPYTQPYGCSVKYAK